MTTPSCLRPTTGASSVWRHGCLLSAARRRPAQLASQGAYPRPPRESSTTASVGVARTGWSATVCQPESGCKVTQQAFENTRQRRARHRSGLRASLLSSLPEIACVSFRSPMPDGRRTGCDAIVGDVHCHNRVRADDHSITDADSAEHGSSSTYHDIVTDVWLPRFGAIAKCDAVVEREIPTGHNLATHDDADAVPHAESGPDPRQRTDLGATCPDGSRLQEVGRGQKASPCESLSGSEEYDGSNPGKQDGLGNRLHHERNAGPAAGHHMPEILGQQVVKRPLVRIRGVRVHVPSPFRESVWLFRSCHHM